MNESSAARSTASWLFALTILISAYLLFLVQPLISKAILPWFGGSTSVWTTCLLFFQVMLLAGYGYAHLMAGLSGKVALRIHAALLIGAVVLLPITPSDSWKPGPTTAPVQGIALLLLANVGLAYFLLASTGPLVQAWFARTYPDRSPYRLYALSNIGSFAALLMYPFVVEPALTVKHQGWAWSGGFVVFAVLAGAAAASIRTTTHKKAEVAADDPMPPNLWNHVLWLALPAFASALLLILTNHICLDVAVVPFLWIAPLSLYLLTFIICFDHSRWYVRGVWSVAGLACAGLLATMLNYEEFDWFFRNRGIPVQLEAVLDWLVGLTAFLVPAAQRDDWNWAELSDNILLQTAAYLALLFTVCMVCHGELVRRKPHAASLTRFYLMISAGGALGGVAVALIAPLCFSSHFEFNIAMVASAALCGLVLWIGLRRSWFQLPVVACAAVVVAMVIQSVKPNEREVIVQRRGFYGVLQVAEREVDLDGYGGYALFNGRILHGFQFHDPARRDEPSTYYCDGSGVALAMQRFPRDNGPLRIGVVGLGTGTMAAHAHQGDRLTFYEINPIVEEIAREQFTFLEDSPAEIDVRLGDARISMERQEPQQFDVLVLDAFAGDAIPIHLLTEEAFDLYQKHMKPDGVIVVHTSNLYLDLLPVVRGLADRQQREAIVINYYSDDDALYSTSSEWVLVTNNERLLEDDEIQAKGDVLQVKKIVRWTDQYSSLVQVLN